MRLALIADVHSNREALTAVLREVDRRGADRIVSLGDVVGYGADAQACVDLVRARATVALLGNHDVAVATGNVLGLPEDGKAAALHNAAQIDDDARAWLASLPLTATIETATLVHATPETPERWLRADAYPVVHRQFGFFETPVCFAGHQHVPAVTGEKVGQLRVRVGGRFFVVVGACGQPRDGDPRAGVSFFDTEALTHDAVRVPYYVDGAAQSVVDAGLPPSLAHRLKRGR